MNNWLIFAFLSALFAAATSILAKIGMTGVSSNLATAIRTVVILGLAWILVFFTGELKGLTSLTSRHYLFLILSGLATGLSWLFYFQALQLGPASKVVPIDKFSLVLALIMAATFLGERITWATALGAALITSGTLIIALIK